VKAVALSQQWPRIKCSSSVYCDLLFWATLWKSSSNIIRVTLITENFVIFCLHSVIGDYILLFVPSDCWILDILLSLFQFCFLVDVIIFICNFSGLVSCLLLIFYIKRLHTLDELEVPRDWPNSFWWLQQDSMNLPILMPDDENAVSEMLSLKKSKTLNHVQNNILVCCNKPLLLHDYHCSDLSSFREMCHWIERIKYCYLIASSVWENHFHTARSK